MLEASCSLREDLDVQKLGWYVAPDFSVNEELPDILICTLRKALEPGVRAAELLEHLGKVIIECSFSPVAVIRKDESEAAI